MYYDDAEVWDTQAAGYDQGRQDAEQELRYRLDAAYDYAANRFGAGFWIGMGTAFTLCLVWTLFAHYWL